MANQPPSNSPASAAAAAAPPLVYSSRPASIAAAPLVAVASWVLPGAGYVLIGQRARGLTIGVTIIVLFLLGLLIAGVRVMEVPGYDANGKAIEVPMRDLSTGAVTSHWVMGISPLVEVRSKPWIVPQLLTGPIAIGAAGWSVYESRPDPNNPTQSRGDQSHARVNEIGSLYLSVAGLLNLMAIIDAAHRAAQRAGA
ncbi:MAG TPA: DUF6677 family protein [Tepidisphaeraceae bacterium]|nr:DUF6677 family protein [Tepidisphaeraceae bacterium]